MGSACFVTNKRAWSVLKCLFVLMIFFMDKKGIPSTIPKLPSTLASFITEIFHECCPFFHSPFPLVHRLSMNWHFYGQLSMHGQLSIVWTIYGQFWNHGQLSIDYGQLSMYGQLSIWTIVHDGQLIVHAWTIVHGPLWTIVHTMDNCPLSMSMYTS